MSEPVLVPVSASEEKNNQQSTATVEDLNWVPSDLVSEPKGQPHNNQFETVSLLGEGVGTNQPSAATAPTDNTQQTTSPGGLCGCLSVKYYASMFNVDTTDVVNRMIGGVTPFKSPSFLESIGTNPDLYGLFWLSTTLVFVIGATSNLNSWINTPADKVKAWTYDFTLMTAAASVVFGYALFAPVCVWFALRYYAVNTQTLLSLMCLYGYSLTVYLPISLLCLAPSDVLAWIAMVVGISVSGGLLVSNLYPIIKQESPASSILLAVALVGLQTVFGLVLKLFFFGKLATQ